MSSSKLEKLDIFGSTFQFTFRGESHYRTRMGAICSIVTVTILITLCTLKAAEHLGRMDPLNAMTITVDENDEAFDLYHDGGYRFAIKDIDEKFGEIRVSQVTKVYNETSKMRERHEIPMELIPCQDEALRREDESYDNIFGIDMTSEKVNFTELNVSEADFLCPTNSIDMTVSGLYHSHIF